MLRSMTPTFKRLKDRRPSRYQFFAPTVDWWSGNYLGDLVKIQVFGLVSGVALTKMDEPNMHRILVSGNDDSMCSLDRVWTWREAIDFANNEIKFPVEKSQLLELGFEFW